MKLFILLFLCAVFIECVPTRPPNPAFYCHHRYGQHHHFRILSPLTPTPPYMISATTDATVYYRHHFQRLCISPLCMIATTTDSYIHILSPLPPTPTPHRRVDCYVVPLLPPNTARHRGVVDCAGVWNSFQEKREIEVAVVHQYVETYPTSNYKWV